MTQKLNFIMSRFAFHEMRILACRSLMTNIERCLENIFKEIAFTRPLSPNHPLLSLPSSSKRLQERLAHIRSDHDALLLELNCNSKIASSQLQIVRTVMPPRKYISHIC
jgi:hypothetical protein